MSFFNPSGLISAISGAGKSIGNTIGGALKKRNPFHNSTIKEDSPSYINSTPSVDQPTIALSARGGGNSPLDASQSEYGRLAEMGRRLGNEKNIDENGNIIQQPGRFKSGLIQMLRAAGEAARGNMESGHTDWKDWASIGGAGAAGLGVGVAKPSLIVKARHDEAVAKNKQAQQEELDRMSGLAKVKGVQAEAARDDAYAAEHTPEALKAEQDRKASEKKETSQAKSYSEILGAAKGGADPEYVQTLLDRHNKQFGSDDPLPKFSSKTSGSKYFNISNSDGSQSRYKQNDDGSVELVMRGEPSGAAVNRDVENEDTIQEAEAKKRGFEAKVNAAKESVGRAQMAVQELDKQKPAWNQDAANNEDTGPDYIKKYNSDLKAWTERRDRAQTEWNNAVEAQKKAESDFSTSYVPPRRSVTSQATSQAPHSFTKSDVEKRAKAAGVTPEVYKARVKLMFPNAKFVD